MIWEKWFFTKNISEIAEKTQTSRRIEWIFFCWLLSMKQSKNSIFSWKNFFGNFALCTKHFWPGDLLSAQQSCLTPSKVLLGAKQSKKILGNFVQSKVAWRPCLALAQHNWPWLQFSSPWTCLLVFPYSPTLVCCASVCNGSKVIGEAE